MKWTNETITARLDEIEKTRNSKKAQFDRELREAKTKLVNIEAALNEAEEPEDYKKLLRDKTETENYISFLTRRTNTAKPDVDQSEYKEIQSFLLDEIESTQAAYVPVIEKKFSELLNVLEEYYTKANEGETIRDRACMVFLGHGISYHKTSDIIDKANDPLLYADHMLRAFFNHRVFVANCYRRIMNPVMSKAPYVTTSEAKVCEELKRRIKKK